MGSGDRARSTALSREETWGAVSLPAPSGPISDAGPALWCRCLPHPYSPRESGPSGAARLSSAPGHRARSRTRRVSSARNRAGGRSSGLPPALRAQSPGLVTLKGNGSWACARACGRLCLRPGSGRQAFQAPCGTCRLELQIQCSGPVGLEQHTGPYVASATWRGTFFSWAPPQVPSLANPKQGLSQKAGQLPSSGAPSSGAPAQLRGPTLETQVAHGTPELRPRVPGVHNVGAPSFKPRGPGLACRAAIQALGPGLESSGPRALLPGMSSASPGSCPGKI